MQEAMTDDDLFILLMLSEIQQKLTESQAEKEIRCQGSQHESPSLTWNEFVGNFN